MVQWFYDTLVITPTHVLVGSRLIIIACWLWAAGMMWRHRDLPHTNHALAGALALVLSQAMILVRPGIPYEILVFFLALSHLTLGISFVRLILALARAGSGAESVPATEEDWKVARKVVISSTLGLAVTMLTSVALAP